MGLELNDVRAPYRDFRTDEVMKYSKQMPLLIADARNPITVAQVMERRLNSERADWKNNYIYTGRMFAEMGKKWKYTQAMGIYLSGAQKVETARALAVSWARELVWGQEQE